MQVPNNARTTLVKSTTQTASPSAVPFNNVGYNSFIAYLNVTAHAGTSPTLSVQFQDSADGTNFANVGSAINVTTTNGLTRTAISSPIGNKLQAVITIGGTTPSYTYSLDVVGTNT